MEKYRILEKNNLFYPQYYKTYWCKCFNEWLNFQMYDGNWASMEKIDVSYESIESARAHIQKQIENEPTKNKTHVHKF